MNLIKNLTNKSAQYLSTCFGIGLIPFAPGTFGTLFALFIWLIIPDSIFYNSTSQSIYYENYIYLAIGAIILYFLGVYITKVGEEKLGHDCPSIVFDELVGFMVSVLFLPKTLMISIYAFTLFRVFDIGKPYPVKQIQILKHGWGIMTDDVLAGIYTNVLIQILLIIFPKFFK